MEDYFESLEKQGIKLTDSQKLWYTKKAEVLGENIKKEYPSTPDEAFEVNVDGLYYARYISIARSQKRICNIPWDRQLRVHTAWDLGFSDANTIIFFQISGREIHIVDYLEGSGYSMADYIKVVKSKDYIYGTHLAPHDLKNHEYSTGRTRYETAQSLGITFDLVPDISIIDGIDAVKTIFPRLWFHNNEDCLKLIGHLESYTQKWDRSLGQWSGRPEHNAASHACFVGNTQISMREGTKSIKDVEIGDEVRTPTGYRKVISKFRYVVDQTLDITTTSSRIECTKNHKIFTHKGLVYSDSLRYNDVLMHEREDNLCLKIFGSKSERLGTGFRENFSFLRMENPSCMMDMPTDGTENIEERVQSIVGCSYPEKREVFDIEVEKDHCYYANGLLVSNSDALRYLVVGLDACLAEGQSMTDAQAEALYRQHVRR